MTITDKTLIYTAERTIDILNALLEKETDEKEKKYLKSAISNIRGNQKCKKINS